MTRFRVFAIYISITGCSRGNHQLLDLVPILRWKGRGCGNTMTMRNDCYARITNITKSQVKLSKQAAQLETGASGGSFNRQSLSPHSRGFFQFTYLLSKRASRLQSIIFDLARIWNMINNGIFPHIYISLSARNLILHILAHWRKYNIIWNKVSLPAVCGVCPD